MGATLTLVNPIQAADPPTDTVLIDWNHTWSYLAPPQISYNPDLAIDPADFTNTWFTPEFNEAAGVSVFTDNGIETMLWNSGPGPFEYGGINAMTGALAANTQIEPVPASGERGSVYFRTTFNLASAVSGVVVDTIVDDAAVWFLDGVEVPVLRTAPDTGSNPLFDTYTAVGPEDNVVSYQLPGTVAAGQHTLAVIVHQANSTSSDLGMGARMYSPGTARVWATDVSGDWFDTANWRIGEVANTATEFAVFGSAYLTQHSIWLDQDVALDGMHFDNQFTYNIGGTGTITLQGNNRPASLNSVAGVHELQTKVRLGANTEMNIASYDIPADDPDVGIVPAALVLRNQFNMNGRTMTKVGDGELLIMSRAATGTSGTLNVNAGSLAGDGTLRGNLVVGADGTVHPTGFSAASEARASHFTVAGTSTFNAGSSLTLTLYGNDSNDRLISNGALSFASGSSVDVLLAGGFTPADGDSFDLVDGTISGPMPTLNLPTGFDWDTSLFASSGVISIGGTPVNPADFNNDGNFDTADINELTRYMSSGAAFDAKYDLTGDSAVTPADIAAWLDEAAGQNGFAEPYLLGDTNLDGTVNFADFVNMNNNWQSTTVGVDPVAWQFGDFNGDGVVSFPDFVAQNNNWQRTISSAAAAAVPEPGTFGLIGMGLLGLLGRRRRS
jgi:hypothetical protein